MGGFVGYRTARAPIQPENIIVKSAPKSRYQPKGAASRTPSADKPSLLSRLSPKKLLSRAAESQETRPKTEAKTPPRTISREGPHPGTSIEILPEE